MSVEELRRDRATICVAFHIIDSMTEIPALAIIAPPAAPDPDDSTPGRRTWWRAGFGGSHVVMVDLIRVQAEPDPYRWPNGTLRCAHIRLRDPETLAALLAHGDGFRLDVEADRMAGIEAAS